MVSATAEAGDNAMQQPASKSRGPRKRRRPAHLAAGETVSNNGVKSSRVQGDEEPGVGEVSGNGMHESRAAYNSHLFKLQISELLGEVRMKEGRRSSVQFTVDALIKILCSAPPGTPEDLQRVKSFTPTAKLPIALQPKTTLGTFSFLPPVCVEVVGGFAIAACVKPRSHVDLVVTMPKACFRAKDSLNQRYIRKRALYLSHLVDHLGQQEAIIGVQYGCQHGNRLKPLLIVQMSVKGSTQPVTLHLLPVPEHDSFALSRLHFHKNNVRPRWYRGDAAAEDGNTEPINPPTPRHNASILSDFLMVANNAIVRKTVGASVCMRDGVCLLKVWAHQRQLCEGYGGVSGFILTMFVCYLLRRRKLTPMMSSYQVLTTTLKHLTLTDWSVEPISLADLSQDNVPQLTEALSHFDVVFMDETGKLNFCADMNLHTYYRLKHEASLSLSQANTLTNPIDALLITPVPFVRKFDHIFHIEYSALQPVIDKLSLADHLLDCGGDLGLAALPSLLRILRTTLGPRVTLVQSPLVDIQAWDTDKKVVAAAPESALTFGLLLDTTYSSNVLEKGPSADSPQAGEFRDTWGDRSNMRRFQDGTICEAVVWDADTVADRRLVSRQIVQFVLHRQAGITPESVVYLGGCLDPLLHRPPPHSTPYGTGEEQSLALQSTYDALAKTLRALQLPLSLNTVQGTSPGLRSTEVFPALGVASTYFTKPADTRRLPVVNMPCPQWMPAHTVVCTLEDSAKWPDDPEAIRRIKAALYVKMGGLLQAQEMSVRVSVDCVHVVKDCFAFHLMLASGRELSALRRVTTAEGMVKIQDTPASQELQRVTVALPLLASTLSGIQGEMVSYCNTVRLAKRWVSSHLLSDHLPPESIELIAAHLFLHPAPFAAPSCAMTGFLRFLWFLSTFDWNLSPLIVNLNSDFTNEDIRDIEHDFHKTRAAKPLMCISTPHDRPGHCWTRHAPTAPVLSRLAALARASSRLLEAQLLAPAPRTDFKVIFRPSLDDYDTLIYLRPDQLPQRHESVDPRGDNVKATVPTGHMTNFPVVDYNPVELYLRDLRKCYDHFALFFYDHNGGDVIGVLWKPRAFQIQPFSVSSAAGRKPCVDSSGEDVNLVPCVDGIVDGFGVIGQQLVARVEPKTRAKNKNKFKS